MTPRTKKLRIACHPDRHGGDESVMEDFYALMKRNVKSLRNTCRRCGTVIGAVSTYCRICYRLPRLIAAALIVFAGCAGPKPEPAQVATPPLPMRVMRQQIVEAPTLPPAPPRLIGCAWDAPANYNPLTESFEVWATTNLARPFTLKTNTTATIAQWPMQQAEFYKVRTRNSEGDVSDWATTR